MYTPAVDSKPAPAPHYSRNSSGRKRPRTPHRPRLRTGRRSASNMRTGCAPRHAYQRPTCKAVPVRCTKPSKRRDEVTIICACDAGGQRLNIRCLFDDLQSVTQPLHCGATHKYGAFQAVGWEG